MRKVFFGVVVGLFLGSLGVVVAQTPTIFSAIRVNTTSDLRGNVANASGNLTLADAVDVTGKFSTAASAAVAGAGLILPHGTAPNSPVNGDLWSTTTGFFGRVNGVTVGPFSAGGSASFPLLGPDGTQGVEAQYSFTSNALAGMLYEPVSDAVIMSSDAGTANLISIGSMGGGMQAPGPLSLT